MSEPAMTCSTCGSGFGFVMDDHAVWQCLDCYSETPIEGPAVSACRNCDKPGAGPYCSTVCEDMDAHPAPRDIMETLTTPSTTWDTDEVIRWLDNDHGLYTNVYGQAGWMDDDELFDYLTTGIDWTMFNDVIDHDEVDFGHVISHVRVDVPNMHEGR